MAVDRRVRQRPVQQSLFGEEGAPRVNENAWRLTEAHRAAGRAGVATGRETLARSAEEAAYLEQVHEQIFGGAHSAGDPWRTGGR